MTSSADKNTGPATPEEYAQMHRQAFRAAFDYLNAHFPPSADGDWWAETMKDAVTASESIPGGKKLTMELTLAVYAYLETEMKRRLAHGAA